MNDFPDEVSPSECLKSLAEKINDDYGFDTVQIIATVLNSDGTTNRHTGGVGNWYARYGSMREWLIKEEEASREETKKSMRGDG